MEIFGITGIASITVICYLAGMGIKVSPLDDKYIPVICGCLGAVLGIAGKALIADFPAADFINALALGAVSGLAATGLDQSVKQLKGQEIT